MRANILILGAGDLGTACALRLFRAGFGVVIAEQQRPLDIHFHRTYNAAAYTGSKTIENIPARTFSYALESGMISNEQNPLDYLEFQLNNREIAYLVPPDFPYLKKARFDFLIVSDPALQKSVQPALNDRVTIITFTHHTEAMPGHYRIIYEEPHKGRVFYPFLQDTFEMSDKSGRESETHLIRAPLEGVFIAEKSAGDFVHEKEVIGKIGDIPILAPQNGHLSGMLNSGILIDRGTVFAEIQPPAKETDSRAIPAAYFNLAGGVLEAVLYHQNLGEE